MTSADDSRPNASETTASGEQPVTGKEETAPELPESAKQGIGNVADADAHETGGELHRGDEVPPRDESTIEKRVPFGPR